MWFGLIPGPYRMVRRACRPARRNSSRSRTHPNTTSEPEAAKNAAGILGIIGAFITLSHSPGALPNPGIPAPYGWNVHTNGTYTPAPTPGSPAPADVVGWISPHSIQNTWAWFVLGLVLLITAAALGVYTLRCGRHYNDYRPPPDFPPAEQLPAPVPQPDPLPLRTLGGHKPLPVNREAPADRPHPWRTWEG